MKAATSSAAAAAAADVVIMLAAALGDDDVDADDDGCWLATIGAACSCSAIDGRCDDGGGGAVDEPLRWDEDEPW